MQRLRLLAFVVAAAVGCGGSDTSVAPDSSNTSNTNCTITLSGGRTGSLACSNLVAIQTSNDNKTSLGFKGVDATDTLTAAIGFNGSPVVQTYVSGVSASPTMLLIDANMVWITSPNDGTLSLNITSVKLVSSGAGLTKYEVHGTLTATMIAEVSNGSVPPVTVTATF